MLVKDDAGLRAILSAARTIAVVGLSSDPSRPSHGVAQYLQRVGYRIIPVNPHETQVLGVPAVADLRALAGEGVDMVDVFRRPREVPPHVEEAIAIGARVLWLQVGVVNDEAAARASAAGLQVVMNRCTLREHARLFR
jgi:uncharacterized protein